MKKSTSIIQYVISIAILMVCALICLTCLLMSILQFLYGGILDFLLMYISAIFLSWSYRKKITERKMCGTLALKGSLVVLGCSLYFFLWNYAFMRCQPLSILMFVLVTVWAIYTSAKGTPTIIKVIIAALFLGIGIYTVFHNDIYGPLIFSIVDRPIDRPSQWLHCYRFYWTGMILHMTVWDASFLSFLLLAGYKVFKKLSTLYNPPKYTE